MKPAFRYSTFSAMALFAGIIMTSGLTVLSPVAGAQESSTLRVIISGVRNTNGNMNVCLWKNPGKFPYCDPNAIFKHIIAKPVLGTTLVAFENVPFGSYALSISHDENSNGKLDKHWIFPYPIEGVGVSNIKELIKRAPKFDEARFDVTNAHSEKGVRIFYPK